jgi:superfamily I DNA/RNA helicase
MAKIYFNSGSVVQKQADYTPSELQKSIFEAVENTQDNILVQARAGSGKTTTLLGCAARIPATQKTLFTAFNKAIVQELQGKLPVSVDCQTLHSICYQALKVHMDKFPRVNNWKTSNILREFFDMEDREEKAAFYEVKGALSSVVGLAKAMNMQAPLGRNTLNQLWDACSNEPLSPSVERIYFCAEEDLFKEAQHKGGKCYEIDFDDMLYLAVQYEALRPTYDCIFVDEAQDLSCVQRKAIEMLLKPGGRIIVAGDKYQAIYGFRGADFDSLENFKAHYMCTELPLSISYRCPNVIVKEANTFVSDFQAHSGVGFAKILKPDDLSSMTKRGDLILCRYNAPLADACLSLMAKGLPAYILGNDVHAELLAHVSKIKAMNQGLFTEEYLIRYNDVLGAGMQNTFKQRRLQDITDTLCIVMQSSVAARRDLEGTLNNMFSAKENAIVCSTIHKAKGTEAENVFILNPENMPSEYAVSQAQLQQEYNLIYVAITRSKHGLYYVTDEQSWSWREGSKN